MIYKKNILFIKKFKIYVERVMFLRSLITKVIATTSQRNNMENYLQARSIFRTVILCSCLKKKN